MKVRIVQCLCPKRHCIAAVAYESAAENPEYTEDLRTVLGEWIAGGTINPWCGLCKAHLSDWCYEDQPTMFATMAEARPALEALQLSNFASRTALQRVNAN